LVWDIFHQEGRSRSSQGVFDALEKTLGKGNVEKLDVTQDIDSDATKGIPVMTAYLAAHPDLKAIGTQHGQLTAILPKILKAAGKNPGDIVVGGIDLGPDVIGGIKAGYVVASFDQVLYLQGFDPVLQIWLTKKYLVPGLHQDTGVGVVTPANVDVIAPLIQQGYR
jgi:simple sugar transport system substrate-binding protein